MSSKPVSKSHNNTQHYVHWFRHSAPYINAHRDKTFVLMFGGEAVRHPNFEHIIHDIALLHSLGIRLILVYGARPQINQNLKEKGIEICNRTPELEENNAIHNLWKNFNSHIDRKRRTYRKDL